MTEQIQIEAICQGFASGEFATVAVGYLRGKSQSKASDDALDTIFRERNYRSSEFWTGQSAYRVLMVSSPGKNITVKEVRSVLEEAGPTVRLA